jgi:tRNA U34 2-thiouridine synthase MnmA/TrmU
MSGGQVTAVALFSGGLDSILSCRLIMAQDIEVKAVRFVTPFFGYELLGREAEYRQEVADKYGIDVQLRDISDKYLAMLREPAHGYGKNFNPCVDCKILIASESRAMLAEVGASFLISGEVIGQRPMSQRRDTLRIIERDSGCDEILLRPLCALNLEETMPEKKGWVDRQKLLAFSGRTRQPQMALAASFGIDDYPSPAGGCVLTDPNKAVRVRRFYEERDEVVAADIRLLMVGRQFLLPGGGWLVIGRDEVENKVILALQEKGDVLLEMTEDWPGPSAILRRSGGIRDLEAAVGLIMRFSKKGEGRKNAKVQWWKAGEEKAEELNLPALEDSLFKDWRH